ATNKVSKDTAATVGSGNVTADGVVTVNSNDSAGIYSNVKVVSMSVTTTDSGVHFYGKIVDSNVPATFDTHAGVQDVVFGDTVRVLHDYAKEGRTPADAVAVPFVSGVTKVKVLAGYANGGDEGVYLYIGPGTSGAPSGQDYSVDTQWVLVAGTDDVVYQYMGPATSLSPDTIDLSRTDYTDRRFWKPLAETQHIP